MGSETARTTQTVMCEIVELITSLECAARDAYTSLAGNLAANDEWAHLAPVWTDLVEQEVQHVDFWKHMGSLACEGRVPLLFEDPDSVKSQLERMLTKTDELRRDAADPAELHQVFLITYWMEFHLLHPALSALMHYATLLDGWAHITTDYAAHIEAVVDALADNPDASPELELLSQVLGELWRRNTALTIEATTDGLTGTLSRAGFERVSKMLAFMTQRNGEAMGVVMFDIDDFKAVNDRFGHVYGDEVLRDVARLAVEKTRRSDAVARYGGDEFIVLMAGADWEAVEGVAEKVRLAVEEHPWPKSPVTVSVGTASGSMDGEPERMLWQLIRSADDRLLHAKRVGHNRVV